MRALARRLALTLIVTAGILALAALLGIVVGWWWFILAGVLVAILDPLPRR